MTSDTLAALTAFSLLKGAIFGALFAWLFPRANGYLLRRLGQPSLPPAAVGSPLYIGLTVLSGSGFALIDLMGSVSDAAGLPEMLRWAVGALFAASAFGTVLVNSATLKQAGRMQ